VEELKIDSVFFATDNHMSDAHRIRQDENHGSGVSVVRMHAAKALLVVCLNKRNEQIID